MLDHLRRQPMTTGQLAELFPLSRFGVMKHLGLLTQAGLVLVRRRGKERWNYLNPVPLRRIYRRWMRPFEESGADTLLRIKELSEKNLGDETVSDQSETTLRALDIQMEISIGAPREQVWTALTRDIAGWWPKDFYVGAAPKGFVLEDRVGGRVYEDWGDGQGLLWANIIVLNRGHQLQWAGDLSPEFGGPARSITTYSLRGEGEETVLSFRNSPYGKLSPATHSALASGWKSLLEGSFKPFVEEGRQPERPDSLEA